KIALYPEIKRRIPETNANPAANLFLVVLYLLLSSSSSLVVATGYDQKWFAKVLLVMVPR
ncbi:MAG TPA: hypothetical protein VIP56_03200, partial [Nitrososphaeraceae archaeon]